MVAAKVSREQNLVVLDNIIFGSGGQWLDPVKFSTTVLRFTPFNCLYCGKFCDGNKVIMCMFNNGECHESNCLIHRGIQTGHQTTSYCSQPVGLDLFTRTSCSLDTLAATIVPEMVSD